MQSSTLSGRGGLWRALYVVIAIEVGLLLLTLPWSPVWDQGVVAMITTGRWHLALLSPYARGGVSGLGLLNLWAAAGEITHFRV